MKLTLERIGFEIDEDDCFTYGNGYYPVYRMMFHCYDETNTYQKIKFDWLSSSDFLKYFKLEEAKFPYLKTSDGMVYAATTWLSFNLTETTIEFTTHLQPDPEKEYDVDIEQEFLLSINLKRFTEKLAEFRKVITTSCNRK